MNVEEARVSRKTAEGFDSMRCMKLGLRAFKLNVGVESGQKTATLRIGTIV